MTSVPPVKPEQRHLILYELFDLEDLEKLRVSFQSRSPENVELNENDFVQVIQSVPSKTAITETAIRLLFRKLDVDCLNKYPSDPMENEEIDLYGLKYSKHYVPPPISRTPEQTEPVFEITSNYTIEKQQADLARASELKRLGQRVSETMKSNKKERFYPKGRQRSIEQVTMFPNRSPEKKSPSPTRTTTQLLNKSNLKPRSHSSIDTPVRYTVSPFRNPNATIFLDHPPPNTDRSGVTAQSRLAPLSLDSPLTSRSPTTKEQELKFGSFTDRDGLQSRTKREHMSTLQTTHTQPTRFDPIRTPHEKPRETTQFIPTSRTSLLSPTILSQPQSTVTTATDHTFRSPSPSKKSQASQISNQQIQTLLPQLEKKLIPRLQQIGAFEKPKPLEHFTLKAISSMPMSQNHIRDIVPMVDSNFLCVLDNSKHVTFYDLSSLESCGQLTGLGIIGLKLLTIGRNMSQAEKELLVIGGERGDIRVIGVNDQIMRSVLDLSTEKGRREHQRLLGLSHSSPKPKSDAINHILSTLPENRASTPDSTSSSFLAPQSSLQTTIKHEDRDYTFRQYDAVWSAQIHQDQITELRYAQVMNCLITSSLDTTVCMTDIHSLTNIATLTPHKRGVTSFDFSVKLNLLVSGGMDHCLCGYNLFTKDHVHTAVGHSAPIVSIVIDSEAKAVLSLAQDNYIRLWHTDTLFPIGSIRAVDPITLGSFNCMSFDNVNNHVLVGSKRLVGMKASIRQESVHYVFHTSPVVFVFFNTEFWELISIDADNRVCVWCALTAQITASFVLSCPTVSAASLDVIGRRLCVGCDNSTIYLFNYHTTELLNVYTLNPPFQSPNNRGSPQKVPPIHIGQILSATSPTAPRAFIATGNHLTLRFINDPIRTISQVLDDKNISKRLHHYHVSSFISSAFAPPNVLALSSEDGSLVIWNSDTGIEQSVLQNSKEEMANLAGEKRSIPIMSQLAFHPTDPSFLITFSSDRFITLWSLSLERQILQIDTNYQSGLFRMDPDGTVLGFTGTDGIMQIYSLGGLTQAAYQFIHTGIPSPLVFHAADICLFNWRASMEIVNTFHVLPPRSMLNTKRPPIVRKPSHITATSLVRQASSTYDHVDTLLSIAPYVETVLKGHIDFDITLCIASYSAFGLYRLDGSFLGNFCTMELSNLIPLSTILEDPAMPPQVQPTPIKLVKPPVQIATRTKKTQKAKESTSAVNLRSDIDTIPSSQDEDNVTHNNQLTTSPEKTISPRKERRKDRILGQVINERKERRSKMPVLESEYTLHSTEQEDIVTEYSQVAVFGFSEPVSLE
ncbi:hypothetical protein BLNAU_16122 [Blattamonas nauphoetae]|uniref:Uncharacterized protein n=1 Tax=Blattamonas nauphoetae TaxID=2049346 RepID=A0ABQ9XB39_9EUKA|nr:hypothetical protein BLNAU_16122 [Blattamonas nauphoetae]